MFKSTMNSNNASKEFSTQLGVPGTPIKEFFLLK